MIGINSVVTKDVSPYEIVAGNPARHIRFRFEPEVIDDLLHSEWWNIPIQVLQGFEYRNTEKFVEQVKDYKGRKACYKKFEIFNRKFIKSS